MLWPSGDSMSNDQLPLKAAVASGETAATLGRFFILPAVL